MQRVAQPGAVQSVRDVARPLVAQYRTMHRTRGFQPGLLHRLHPLQRGLDGVLERSRDHVASPVGSGTMDRKDCAVGRGRGPGPAGRIRAGAGSAPTPMPVRGSAYPEAGARGRHGRVHPATQRMATVSGGRAATAQITSAVINTPTTITNVSTTKNTPESTENFNVVRTQPWRYTRRIAHHR